MITYVTGSIFTSPAKVLVNPVNTVGVMGKGLAKEFKSLFPDMFNRYQILCERQELTVGKLWLYKTPNKWVLNFPTKTTWKQPSRLEYLEAGLKNFNTSFAKQQITSIAFPKLGCGNGELSWADVQPLMEKYLNPIPISVFIHLDNPHSLFTPEHKDIENISQWLRAEPEYLTYAEVLADLKRYVIFLSANSIETPVSHKKFSIDINDERLLILTEDQSKQFAISHRDFRDFWSHTKSYGLLTRQNAPAAFSEVYEYLIGMLASLPYFKLTQVSSRYENLKHISETIGVQLIPNSIRPSNELLGSSPSLKSTI